jgi:Mycobacterial 4 TMS phage holin, superfamily IV
LAIWRSVLVIRGEQQPYDRSHGATSAARGGLSGIFGDRTAGCRVADTPFSVSVSGFITAVLVYSVAQAILAPFIFKMASRYASAFLGGIGLVSTLIALILASVLTHRLTIRGLGSWVAATVLVWVVTALATLLLPVLVIRKKGGSSS